MTLSRARSRFGSACAANARFRRVDRRPRLRRRRSGRFDPGFGCFQIGAFARFGIAGRTRFERLALACGAVRLIGAFVLGAFVTRARRVQLGQLCGQLFQCMLAFDERFRDDRRALFGFHKGCPGVVIGFRQLRGFRREIAERLSRVLFQGAFMREILIGLSDALTNSLRLFAGARFFRVEAVAFVQKALQRRRLVRFRFAQRRQCGSSFGLNGGAFGGALRALGNDFCGLGQSIRSALG